jgi:hypothetical protein
MRAPSFLTDKFKFSLPQPYNPQYIGATIDTTTTYRDNQEKFPDIFVGKY